MEVLGIRFCSVTPEAQQLASFLDSLGLSRREIHAASEPGSPPEPFAGAVFPLVVGALRAPPEIDAETAIDLVLGVRALGHGAKGPFFSALLSR